MKRSFWKAAWIRAIRTSAQTLASTLPVGLVITPVMLQEADWSIAYVIGAWIITGALSGISSILTSIATGLPEVDER